MNKITLADFEKSGDCVNQECNKTTAKIHFALAEKLAEQRIAQKLQEAGDLDDVIKLNAISEIEDGFTTQNLLIDVALIKPIIAKLKEDIKTTMFIIDVKDKDINKLADEITKFKKQNEILQQERDELRQGHQGLLQYQQKLLTEISDRDKQIESLKAELYEWSNNLDGNTISVEALKKKILSL